MLKKLIIVAISLTLFFMLWAAIPTIRINRNAAISSNVISYIRAACYMLPMYTITQILGIQLALQVWRVLIALIDQLKNVVTIFLAE